MDKIYLYAVRDRATGKLVTNITNPGHKFWEKKRSCIEAIERYNERKSLYGFLNPKFGYEGPLELVTFKLTEITDI